MVLFLLSFADERRQFPFRSIIGVCMVMGLDEELATGVVRGEKCSGSLVD